jgi:hypothetical protein
VAQDRIVAGSWGKVLIFPVQRVHGFLKELSECQLLKTGLMLMDLVYLYLTEFRPSRSNISDTVFSLS